MSTVRWAETAPESLRVGVVVDLRDRPSGVLVLDAQGRVVGANRTAEGLFGPDSQTWLGRSREGAGLRLISPDGALLPLAEDPLGRALAGDDVGAAHVVGLETPGPSGAPRLSWLEVTAIPVRDSLGRVAGITSTWSDITTSEAGRAATTRVARSARLLGRESAFERARFGALAEITGHVVLQTDIAGQVAWASSSLTDVLGWNSDEIVGSSFLPLVHPDDRERINEARRAALQAQVDDVTVTELRYATRDGGWRWMRVTTRRLHDDAGRALGAMAAAQDISAEVDEREQRRYLDRYDGLTGLVTREAAVHHLTRALESVRGTGRHTGLLHLDVDHFTRVNDTFGLSTGDELLIDLAQRLKATLRESDVVARLGADEFLVVLSSLREDWHAVTRAQSLRETLATTAPQGLPPVTLSIGVVVDDGDGDAAAMLVAAEAALRRAKLAGRDRIAF